MKNAFDEFDAPKGNVFDEFDAPADTRTKTAPVAKKERTVAGEGGRQVGLLNRALTNAVASPFILASNIAEKFGVDPKRNVGRRLNAALTAMGSPEAETGVEKFTQDIAQQAPAFAIPANLPAQALGNATMGAAFAKPGDETQGAVIGAAIPTAIKGLGNAAGWMRDKLPDPTGRVSNYLKETFGDRANQVIADLRALKGYSPGEKLTAGRAATTNTPELKALEEQARRSQQGHLFTERDAANEAARLAPVEAIAEPGRKGVAQFEGSVPPSQYEALRESTTTPMYVKARLDRVQLTPQLRELLTAPDAQDAMRAAGRSFNQGQVNASVAGRPIPRGEMAAKPPPAPYSYMSGKDYSKAQEPFMPNLGSRSIGELQGVKAMLTKKINSMGGAPTLEKSQLIESRNQLDAMMRKQSGNYDAASEMYRNLSAPQNEADIAIQMVKALRGPVGERPTAVLGAFENAPQTIQKAGGQPRYKQIEQIMQPDNMATLDALRKGMRREADYNALDASSKMLPDSGNVLDALVSGSPGMINRTVTTTKAVLRDMSRGMGSRSKRLLNEAIVDPTKLTDIMTSLPASERSAFIKALRESGRASPLFNTPSQE